MCAICLNMCKPAYTYVPVPTGHEEQLIPYSLVQPMQVQTKRPVIFSPSLLSRGLIERLLQPAESGLNFNTCPPGMHRAHTQTHTHLLTDTKFQTLTHSVNKKVDDSSFDHYMIHRLLLFPMFRFIIFYTKLFQIFSFKIQCITMKFDI